MYFGILYTFWGFKEPIYCIFETDNGMVVILSGQGKEREGRTFLRKFKPRVYLYTSKTSV